MESNFGASPLLSTDGIYKKSADINILTDVNISLLSGEIHGLLGVDGAGKTTLINILSGVLPPDSGRILIHGKPARLDSPEKARSLGIGVAHQNHQLVPNMKISARPSGSI